jgi:hypothetical protein
MMVPTRNLRAANGGPVSAWIFSGWHNVTKGGMPLSYELADIILRRVPGLRLHWPYQGRPPCVAQLQDGLRPRTSGSLGALGRQAMTDDVPATMTDRSHIKNFLLVRSIRRQLVMMT